MYEVISEMATSNFSSERSEIARFGEDERTKAN